jgi:two-component system, NtrC family, sensor kinase
MRLTTRLLVTILPIVVLVMGALGGAFAAERQRVLEPALQQQTRAYARALDIAFEYSLREMGEARVQALLERLIADPRVFGARLYAPDGTVRFASSSMTNSPPAPDSVLRRVLTGASEAFFENNLDGEVVSTVLRAVREPSAGRIIDDQRDAPGDVVGVLEVAQPYALLSSEVRRLQTELLVATIALLLIMAIVIGILARRLVSSPLERLVVAARALGEGDIDARVPQALGAAELNALSREFNQMAERLARARQDLLSEGEERIRLERRLVESEKLATVGTLAAGLAHEIGAPLNVISGRAELLLKQPSVAPDTVRQLESIVTQSGRIARTVRSLLDYARRPVRRDDPVAIGRVIDSTMELLDADLARAGVTITRRESYEAWVRGDAEQLQQLLTNLILNAVQAMDGQDGPREIEVGVDVAKVDENASRAALRLTVADSGPGLPQALDGRLFTPFATTKPTGTGLGLVVARSIVEDHGGTIVGTTRSDGRSGAVFVVSLPLAPAFVVGDA